MINLYVTADEIGTETGGGRVTFHESEALKSLGECEVWSRSQMQKEGESPLSEPWGWDDLAESWAQRERKEISSFVLKLAHFYAGTFSETIKELKRKGFKITYTAAAHSIEISRREHELLGLSYNYPHLTDPKLWERYVRGYLEADVLICPSTHSANVMRGYGAKQRIEVIPHGCDLPEKEAPLPKTFTVGYLGSYGPDKGVRHLLKAWKELNIRDGLLVLAGRDSASEWTNHLIKHLGGGNILQLGWLKNPSTFFNQISLLVQPSASEGFGIEILEGMAHGRPVLASENSGGPDVIPFKSCIHSPGTDELKESILTFYRRGENLLRVGEACRKEAEKYTWDRIRQRYVDVWRSLL